MEWGGGGCMTAETSPTSFAWSVATTDGQTEKFIYPLTCRLGVELTTGFHQS